MVTVSNLLIDFQLWVVDNRTALVFLTVGMVLGMLMPRRKSSVQGCTNSTRGCIVISWTRSRSPTPAAPAPSSRSTA